MSLYNEEKPGYLEECLESIMSSSLKPMEIVIVEDGPLTNELYEVLDSYPMCKRVKLSDNVGLGVALNKGLEFISTELVARMDTDDVCAVNRFELQVKEFEKNQSLILIGSDVAEFDDDVNNILQIKKMPRTGREIKKYSEKRNPFNHPTVMFKKEAVKKAGYYQKMPYFEDYYLWLRMIRDYPEESFKNIDTPLVLMRTNEALYNRRGGKSYISKIIYFRYICVIEGLLKIDKAIYSSIASLAISILPNQYRRKFYRIVLRRK